MASNAENEAAIVGDRPADPLDAAFQSVADAVEAQLGNAGLRELTGINLAMLRAKQGTYGNCDECSCPISIGRLQALPHTTVCVVCAARLESAN